MAETPLPEAIRPYFTAPTEWRGKTDGRRSPLLFSDGRRASSEQEWSLRREEIRRVWMNYIGAWPALLTRPRLERGVAVERGQVRQIEVTVELAADDFHRALLLIPEGAGPFPAVVVPFYEPETSVGQGARPLRDFGYQLAKRGMVALCLGSPGGDARKPNTGRIDWQPLSYLAYLAANAHTVLAQLPEVDPARIGIVGHSYGGKWAMFAACFYDKFACGVWSDPGVAFTEDRISVNYWEPWYLGQDEKRRRSPGLPTAENPRTGAYARLVEANHDLHEVQALMAPPPFLVSGGAEDPPYRWLTLNHCVEVNGVLGLTGRVAMTNRPLHDPSVDSNAVIYQFLKHFLQAPAP